MKKKFIDYFANVAELTANLSSAKKLKVGAIIVKDNRIISIGYNGMPSGWSNECETIDKPHWMDFEPRDDAELGQCRLKTKSEVLHAEANAITKLARCSESGLDATMFVTHTPCIECAKLIYQSGISSLYIKNNYSATKGSGRQFLLDAGVHVHELFESVDVQQ